MSVEKFIPKVWSAKINQALRKRLVYANIVNNDYQGDVKYGNAVNINQLGAVTINDYDRNNGVGDIQELDSEQTTLQIDQKKSFNFHIHDIDAVQSNVALMNQAADNAAYAAADHLDQYIASKYKEVKAGNTIGSDASPELVTALDAYDAIVDLGVILSENNAPKEDRGIVVPEFFYGLLQKDPRFTKDPSVLATGYIGNVNGMQVFTSNNVPVVNGNYKIIAAQKKAISAAYQIDKVAAYRPEKFMSDALKGLQVYGVKTIKPEAMAVMTVARSNGQAQTEGTNA